MRKNKMQLIRGLKRAEKLVSLTVFNRQKLYSWTTSQHSVSCEVSALKNEDSSQRKKNITRFFTDRQKLIIVTGLIFGNS